MKRALPICMLVAAWTADAADTPSLQNATGIRINHRIAPTAAMLEQGYLALRQGLLPQAREAYDRVLAADPKNVDGLNGLAIVALRENRLDVAERHYRQMLALDPRNANAVAALSDLRSSRDETRLKLLLAEQPDNAALHFALGNLHARAQRWHEAQQAWFRAYVNDAANPDIVFNLAVGLDRIGQRGLAAQYYAEALRLADSNAGSHTRTAAQTRLQTLEAH